MTEEDMQKFKRRIIIGLTEEIQIWSREGKSKDIRARIDTGATRNSIDADLAKELKLGPIVRTKLVKQAQGHTIRPIVMAKFKLAGEIHKEEFTIAERKHMKYSVLIGQNGLNNGYLIDPHKK